MPKEQKSFHAPFMLMLGTDQVLDHGKIAAALEDLADKGVDLVCVEFRGCLYSEFDEQGRAALRFAEKRAHELGMMVSKTVPYRFTEAVKKMPQIRQRWLREIRVFVSEGHFSAVLPNLAVRGGENLVFLKLLRAFSVRRDQEGRILSARDVTGEVTYRVCRETELSLSGSAPEEGELLLYPLYQTDLADFSHADIYQAAQELLAQYDGLRLDGFALDEFGTGTRLCGVYHGSDSFLEQFAGRFGYRLEDCLFLLENRLPDGQEASPRVDYYTLTMEITKRFHQTMRTWFQEKYGEDSFAGFHHTWWGEGNAGDLWAGSYDYFGLTQCLCGGFVDAQYDAERTMLSMTALAESLAKYSEPSVAYNMCWDRHPTHEKMDYYHRLLAVRNVRWVGHGYGDTGIFGPGYPDHPTWDDVKQAIEGEKAFQQLFGAAQSRPEVAVLFLWEAAAYWNEPGMHYQRLGMKALSERLLRAQVEHDILPTDPAALARYQVLFVPWAPFLSDEIWEELKRLAAQGKQLIFIGPPPQRTASGRDIFAEFCELIGGRPEKQEPYPAAFNIRAEDLWFTKEAIPMPAFPVAPTDGEAGICENGKLFSVRRGSVSYYGFELAMTKHFDGVLDSLRPFQNPGAGEDMISKLAYESGDTVYAAAARWGGKLQFSFSLCGISFSVENAAVFGVRIKENGELTAVGNPAMTLVADGRAVPFRALPSADL